MMEWDLQTAGFTITSPHVDFGMREGGKRESAGVAIAVISEKSSPMHVTQVN